MHEEDYIKELAAFVDGSFVAKPEEDLESFDEYTYQLKRRLYLNPEKFRERFIKGYEVLMQWTTSDQK